MNVLYELQNWYQSHCDGDWEHQYGIEIGNLENPGWEVKIDLVGTELEVKPFNEIKVDNSEEDWMFCKIENMKFAGYADSQKLEKILQIFLVWAKG